MKSTDYLLAKLETIHEDVKTLQVQVDDLRQDMSGRKAVQKFLATALGGLGVVVAWLVTHVSNLSTLVK